MDERGGGNQGIAVGTRVRHQERSAPLRNGDVNSQNPPHECGQYVPVHPGVKHLALFSIAAFQ